MTSGRKYTLTFVLLSYGVLTFIYILEDGSSLRGIQVYREFPFQGLHWRNITHTKENPLRLQDEFYGEGCEANPYREGLQILLQEWSRMAERRNISKSFICFGSMLGSLRNGDVIPLDTDADICMLRDEYHKLYAEESRRPLDLNDGKIRLLLQRHSPHPSADTPREDCNGKIVRTTTDDCSILDPHARLYIHSKIYLDIFMIEDHGDIFWDEYRNVFHRRDVLFPLKPCYFLGMPLYCPRNHTQYLTSYYGTNFMEPLTICKRGRWIPNAKSKKVTKFFLIFFILISVPFLRIIVRLFPILV
ncbi:uncharacterized protein LOC114520542 [Dendronephthya gigantea]|uniref:uncharacterized protein LOC114520542 n=1 Tax=Dendronephthya gigantea TaxID=151771 RepID=UPI00106C8277|nr:uncharacterized protein LOC114520542 [Dendronephthya gigantea]